VFANQFPLPTQIEALDIVLAIGGEGIVPRKVIVDECREFTFDVRTGFCTKLATVARYIETLGRLLDAVIIVLPLKATRKDSQMAHSIPGIGEVHLVRIDIGTEDVGLGGVEIEQVQFAFDVVEVVAVSRPPILQVHERPHDD